MFGSILYAGSAAAASAPLLGLAGYWNFDESTGNSTLDSSGNNNSGTMSGAGLTRVLGKVGGGALSFDGASGSVTIPHSASLDLRSSFTLSAWIRPVALSSYRTAVHKGNSSSCTYWLQTSNNRASSGFGTTSNCSSYKEHVPTNALPVNQWSHVTARFDDAANTFAVYINGSLVYSANEASAPASTPEALIFGQSTHAGGNYERWNGQLDEVRIYNRALAPQEVLDVLNDTGSSGGSDVQAPTAPTNVIATAISASQINLVWTASTDAVGVAGYHVYRGSARVGTTVSPSYADTGLLPSTSYVYAVQAYDAAQNVSAQSAPFAAASTLPVMPSDGIPPSVSLTAPASNAIVRGSAVVISANATDNVGVTGVQFLLDGSVLGQEDTAAPFNVSWNSTLAADGSHQLAARVRDAAGNLGESTARDVRVDNLAPTGAVEINGGASHTRIRTISLSLAAADAGSSVAQMRLSNGGSYSAAESFAATKAWTLTSGGGVKTVSVQFRDVLGTWSQAFTDTIVYDPTAPTISSVGSSNIGTSSATITWTTNEASTSQVEYGLTTAYGSNTLLDATLVTGHSMTLAGLAPNTAYNYRVWSSDAAGNQRAGVNGTFRTLSTPDTIAPVVLLIEPANGAAVAGSVRVSATASDDLGVASVEFYIDGTLRAEDPTAPFQMTWDTTGATNGNHSLFARARDTSGNVTTSATASVAVNNLSDTEPPSVPTNLSAAVVSSGQVNLSWNASIDNSGAVSYRLFRNGSSFASSSTTNYANTGLTAATTYTYTVQASDAAGNSSMLSSPVTATTLPATGTTPFVYPLRLSADGMSMTDQESRPFFINGDTAWSLIAQLTQENTDAYLTDRRQKGYNLVLVSLIERRFATNAPANIYGAAPFAPSGTFTAPNEAYFAHADWVINKAAENGLVVLLDPLYLGYACGSQGWCPEVQASSNATMRAWGRFVGNRYKTYPNIIWLIGGDTDPVANGLATKMREFVAGIRDFDTTHLMTAHNGPEQSAMAVWPSEAWLDLNNIYTYSLTYQAALGEYNRASFKPFFLLESAYENEHGSTPASLRNQAYGAVLSGATLGHLFGNCPMWAFGHPDGFCNSTDWQQQLNSTGSRTLAHVGKLFSTRAFHRLVPDQTHTVLTAGYQSGASLAVAARTSDGTTVIAYLPTQRTVSIDMSRITGTVARTWWFNPSTAQSTLIGDFPTTGSRPFTPPAAGDWVLVLDDLAQGFTAPGL